MSKRLMIILAVLMLGMGSFCCAANAEQAESVLDKLIVLEDDQLALIPQTDGTLLVHKLNSSASVDEHVAFLQETDWRTVSSYDPQTKTLVYKDSTAINAYYPWRKWTNVQRLISMQPMVFLSVDGRLMSASSDVDVPDWSNLVDAWCLNGYLYDETTETDSSWNGVVGLTADGTMLTTGLPERMTLEIAKWKNICKAYQYSEAILAVDKEGRVYAATPYEQSMSGDVTELFGGAGVKDLLFRGNLCAALKEDGTIFLVEGTYEDGYLETLFIDGNYAAVKSWTNLATARIISIEVESQEGAYTYSSDYYALVGVTNDGMLLADGVRAASSEWADILGVPEEAAAVQAYEPAEYIKRASYRTGLAFSTRYAAMIDHEGLLESAGEVNGSLLYGAADEWHDLVSIAGTFSHIVGLRADGTVVAQGLNSSNQCEVDSWWNITEVAAGDLFTVGLTEYGMVAYAGTREKGAELAKYWNNVMAIDACDDHVVGLHADGTALSTAAENGKGCSEILGWSHLVDIAAGENNRAAGILVDGTVVATRNVSFHQPEDFVNLADIAFSGSVLYGLRSDGTVVASDQDAAEQVAMWTDVAQIDGCGNVLLGMKTDGSLLWAGWPEYADGEIPETLAGWNFYGTEEERKAPFFYDIYAVHNLVYGELSLVNDAAPAAAGDGFVAAVLRNSKLFVTEGAPESLKMASLENVSAVSAYGRQVVVTFKDGSRVLYTDEEVQQLDLAAKAAAGGEHLLTIRLEGEEWNNVIYASGANDYGQCDLQGAAAVTDIVAGGHHSVAVIGGRYLAASGDNSYGQCDVGHWESVRQVAAGERHTLGLTQDGRVLAAGDNTHGQCAVSAWTGKVKMVAAGDRFSAGMTADGHVLLTGDLTAALQQALSWERIVFIAANADCLVGVDASGTLYSTETDVSSASRVHTAELKIPKELYPNVSLDMMYDTLAVGAYGCIAQCEDGSVIRNEIRYNPYYDSVEDYGDYYDEYAIGKKLTIADKPVAMVCAVRDGAVLYEDGTVQASNYFPEAAQWTNVVMISGTKNLLGALTADGKIYLSGDVAADVAAQVANWPPVICFAVGDKHVSGVTSDGYMVSSDANANYDSNVWYDIVRFGDGIAIRSDGSTTADTADGRRISAQGYAKRQWLTVYDDGSTSFEIPGAEFPIVQLEVFGDCFILQQQDGTILLSGDKGEAVKDIHLWKVALPKGVEKILREEEALPDGVYGTATFRPYNRLYIGSSSLLAVLPDGHVLEKSADKWEYDEATKNWKVVETRQAILDESVWYDIVEVVGGLGLRKDGLVVSRDFRGNATIVEGWKNVKKLVTNGYGAILADGTYISSYNNERTQAAAAWTDLVDVQNVANGIVGLRSDGTVVSYGLKDTLSEMISKWRNVIEIVAYKDYYDEHLAGLTTTGEVLLTNAVPGDPPAVTKPVRHIMPCDGAVMALFEDGTVGEATFSWFSFSKLGGDIVEAVANNYLAVGLKADGSLAYTITGDWATDGFHPDYHEWSINTININTLEGVIVTPVPREVPEEQSKNDAASGIAAIRPYERLTLSNGLQIVLPDGRVLRITDNYVKDAASGEWYVDGCRHEILDESIWHDIVEVVGFFGLRSDGTIAIPANDSIYQYYPEIPAWNNVKKLTEYGYRMILEDGSYVHVSGQVFDDDHAISLWKDVVDAYSIYDYGTVALKSDGTLITELLDESIASKVSEWRNIVEIQPYHDFYSGNGLVGLTADGEVLLSGAKPGDPPAAVKPVAHLAGDGSRVYALYQDGTVGGLTRRCFSLDNFDNGDIVEFVCDGYCAIGVKSDGRLVYVVDEGSDAAWEYPNYSAWNLDTININTLEGVSVK